MILILFFTILIYFLVLKCWNYILLYRKVNKLPGPKPVPILGTIDFIKSSWKESLNGFNELCQKYDGIYKLWLGPIPYVIVYDADFTKQLLTKFDAVDKSSIVRFFMREISSSTLFVKYGNQWKRNRKILYSSITQQMVNSFMPTFNKNSRNIVHKLELELNNPKPFDVNTYICEATFDNICETTMGVQLWSAEEKLQFFDAVKRILLEKPEQLYNKKLALEFLCGKANLGQSDCYNIVFNTVGKILDAKSKQMAEDNQVRKDDTFSRKEYLETIIRAKQSNECGEISDTEFKIEILTVLVAGYETTSVTLSLVLLHLAAYKNVQDKVYNELYELYGDSDRPVELDDLDRLDYLNRTIKEVMRILPTILQLVRQTTKDIQLGEYIIPAGVQIYISLYHLHNSKKYWKDPEKFDPDRFLPEEVEKQYPYSYLPFGLGPRMCPGLKYGMMFVKIMLIHILRRYEVSTSTELDFKNIDYTMDISIRPTDGYLISISERERNNNRTLI